MRERARAPAKINLVLRVRERDQTGFHRIETLFCALELADELTLDVEEGHGVTLEVDGPDLGPVDDNLAVRAARSFLDRAGVERAVAIRLKKRIPAGGGLGGGSSDAAAVLRTLARLVPGALSASDLHQVAAILGSDVPFFLRGDPIAVGSARGDVLSPAPRLPSVPVLLAFPPFPVSTRAAYGWLDAERAVGRDGPVAMGEVVPPASWAEAGRIASNDFEGPVFERHPQLRDVRDALKESGASVALLAGSGSTLFGIFPDEDRLDEAVALLRGRAPDVRLASTRSASS